MLVPCLQWPLVLKRTADGVVLGFVEQDSLEEVGQCTRLLLSTEAGSFPDTPGLGVEDPTFTGGYSEDDLIAAVTRWEPRALLAFTGEELAQFIQTIDLETS